MNTVYVNMNEADKGHILETVQKDRIDFHFFDCFGDAERYLELNLVDVVFLDITSRNINWIAQYNRIKLIDNAIIVILIDDNSLKAVKAHEIGAFDFLLKPIDKKQIKRVFQKAETYCKCW